MTNNQEPMTNKIPIYKIPKNIWALGFGILLGFGIWILGFNQVYAARFYFEVPNRDFKVREVIPVRVLVDAEGENINTISLKINYPADILSLDSVNNANSIINFWVGNLVGVTIGGYRGSGGLVSQLNMRALRAGTADISFDPQSETYLNDGLGTKAWLDLEDRAVVRIGEGMAPADAGINDNEPPEDFTPIIARSPNVFDNQYFLIFSTQDKNSGIDHYEVQETRQKVPSPTNWTRAVSPYLLNNQNLSQFIFVRAVDRAGLDRVVGLRPQFESVSPYPWWLWWLLLLLIILILILVTFVIIKRWRDRH